MIRLQPTKSGAILPESHRSGTPPPGQLSKTPVTGKPCPSAPPRSGCNARQRLISPAGSPRAGAEARDDHAHSALARAVADASDAARLVDSAAGPATSSLPIVDLAQIFASASDSQSPNSHAPPLTPGSSSRGVSSKRTRSDRAQATPPHASSGRGHEPDDVTATPTGPGPVDDSGRRTRRRLQSPGQAAMMSSSAALPAQAAAAAVAAVEPHADDDEDEDMGNGAYFSPARSAGRSTVRSGAHALLSSPATTCLSLGSGISSGSGGGSSALSALGPLRPPAGAPVDLLAPDPRRRINSLGTYSRAAGRAAAATASAAPVAFPGSLASSAAAAPGALMHATRSPPPTPAPVVAAAAPSSSNGVSSALPPSLHAKHQPGTPTRGRSAASAAATAAAAQGSAQSSDSSLADLSPVSRRSSSSVSSCMTPRKQVKRNVNRAIPALGQPPALPAQGEAGEPVPDDHPGNQRPPRPRRDNAAASGWGAPLRIPGLRSGSRGADSDSDSDGESAISGSYGSSLASSSALRAPARVHRMGRTGVAALLGSSSRHVFSLRNGGSSSSGSSAFSGSSVSGPSGSGRLPSFSSRLATALESGMEDEEDMDDSVSVNIPRAAAPSGRPIDDLTVADRKSTLRMGSVGVRSRARAMQRGATQLLSQSLEMQQRARQRPAGQAASAGAAATASAPGASPVAAYSASSASSSSAASYLLPSPMPSARVSVLSRSQPGRPSSPLTQPTIALLGKVASSSSSSTLRGVVMTAAVAVDAISADVDMTQQQQQQPTPDGCSPSAADASAGDSSELFQPSHPEPLIRTRRQAAQKQLALQHHRPGEKAARLGTHGRRVVHFVDGQESEALEHEEGEGEEESDTVEGAGPSEPLMQVDEPEAPSSLTIDTAAAAAGPPSAQPAVSASAPLSSSASPAPAFGSAASSRSRRMLALAMGGGAEGGFPGSPAPSPVSAAAAAVAAVSLSEGGQPSRSLPPSSLSTSAFGASLASAAASSSSTTSAAAADVGGTAMPARVTAPLPPALRVLCDQAFALDTAITLFKRRNRGGSSIVVSSRSSESSGGLPLFETLRPSVEQGTQPARTFEVEHMALIAGLAPGAYRFSTAAPSLPGGPLRLVIDMEPAFGQSAVSSVAIDLDARRTAFRGCVYALLWAQQLESLPPSGMLVPQVAAGTAWHPRFKPESVQLPRGELPSLAPPLPAPAPAQAASSAAASMIAAAPAPAAAAVAPALDLFSPEAAAARRRAVIEGRAPAPTSAELIAASGNLIAAAKPARDPLVPGSGGSRDSGTAEMRRGLPMLLERLLRQAMGMGGDGETALEWGQLSQRMLAPGVLPANGKIAFGTPAKLEAGVALLGLVTRGWCAFHDAPGVGRFVKIASKNALADARLAAKEAAAGAAPR